MEEFVTRAVRLLQNGAKAVINPLAFRSAGWAGKIANVVSISSECRVADARDAARSSIYIAATLYCDGASSPIKIRNISVTGALVEGRELPATGALVQLIRGPLIVHGLVAWSAERRCGLQFSGSIDVQKWRAAPVNAEQQRVDKVVRLVKAGAVPLPIPPVAHSTQSADKADPTAQLLADLRRVSDLVENLGDALVSDPQVMTRHATAIQNIDIAAQLIAAAGANVARHGDSLEVTKLVALRRSADQALRRKSEG